MSGSYYTTYDVAFADGHDEGYKAGYQAGAKSAAIEFEHMLKDRLTESIVTGNAEILESVIALATDIRKEICATKEDTI